MRNGYILGRMSSVALSAVLVAGLAGCRGTPAVDDGAVTDAVQKKIADDWSLSPQTVSASSTAGVVTLTGGVDNPAARDLAARDAAGIPGVVKVVNSITVMPEGAPGGTTTARRSAAQTQAVVPLQQRVEAPPPQVAYEPAPVTRTPAAPPPPPVAPLSPAARLVTLPAGSTLPVRVTQTLDSQSTQPGDSFSGAVATDIVVDGMVMIPRGATVTGRVTEVHEATHFKGSSLLTVELTGLDSRGQRISLATQPYSVQGKGRGESTAVKAGVGAAAGAILGGIFGGGKGAAIGAAAGGGTGVGINAVTRGQQVQIPSETVVRFVTTNSIATKTAVHAGANNGDGGLQSR